ncbi:MAG: 50S ribosomal protein L17 [Thermodesulfobacteriota bacterium]|nr:50S ribosomal protein L17 [Thermodesulfobacteriota bacterium]
MRHRKAGIRLSRTTAHREAMVRNMVTSLFMHEKIKTTDAKAKVLRRVAEQMITLAKRGDIHARRQALAVIRDNGIVKKLFEDLRKHFVDRPGGYTRITKIGMRHGDAAPISFIELVTGAAEGEKSRSKKGKGKTAAKKRIASTKATSVKSKGTEKKKTVKKKETTEEKVKAESPE